MNCFPCCGPKKSNSKREHGSPPPELVTAKAQDMKKQKADEQNQAGTANIQAQAFSFRELATATKNFRQECLLDEGGFGRIYRGIIPATGQLVAVKQLDRNGMQSSNEFLAEVAELSLLHHENLVNLIGYCADGDQRLLVYDLFAARTLENRLFENKPDEGPLNWFDRMKIVVGASKGLEYLHETTNPPLIFRDLKASSILVDSDLLAKLCDVGMAKLSGGDKINNGPPRLMGTYGHCAPEYVRAGQLTMKSDVYSFGVVLLELITGRRAIDTTRPNEEQNLVAWATPLFRDPKRYPDMADPLLNKNFPEKDLNQVVAIASMCLQEEAEARPLISDVVNALSFLSAPPPPAAPVPKKSDVAESERESESESGSEAISSKGSRRSSVDESQHDSDSHLPPAVSSKPSRKSSTRSSKGALSSESGDEVSVSSSSKSSRKSHGDLSHKSSKKSSVKDLSQKSSKKSSVKDLSQKSSRKSSVEDLSQQKSSKKSSVEDLSQKSSRKSSTTKDLSQKSSRKSSIRDLSQKRSRKSSSKVLSHKSSMASDDGSISSSSCRSSSVGSERSSMRLSQGSFHSDPSYSSKRKEDESMHLLDRASSLRSDEDSGHPFDQTSSSGSSVYSR
ncbi:hypothetical protein AAZX31_20G206600 [Glycine max]|uniref:Protein kinase domain-containing protein n=1 Tax=Glycine max TaxID=3847 RepID=K7N4Z7_SOYBN|nr:probable serine/threonine-protein kinase PBL25 [Glycine max]KAG5075790.1 hypothetical protein JHK84_057021 [Glycine max]KAH1037368.1 hypothetical protein GYH30_056657 [Glycine max]KAH1191939.1 putative serine/threonine-protein kinase PBL26 [Glycine max]KRG92591.1 hypothetical protein GLYMA_20G220400v4 [Glycine max]|eukprot:XP_014627881.1 probable serine/threonine-protein kinase PBL25 [Glycine max]